MPGRPKSVSRTTLPANAWETCTPMIVIVGMTADGATAAFDPGALAHDGVRIVGSKVGSVRPAEHLPQLAELYLAGRLKLDELVSREYPLDAINDALDDARGGEALRNVVVLR